MLHFLIHGRSKTKAEEKLVCNLRSQYDIDIFKSTDGGVLNQTKRCSENQ